MTAPMPTPAMPATPLLLLKVRAQASRSKSDALQQETTRSEQNGAGAVALVQWALDDATADIRDALRELDKFLRRAGQPGDEASQLGLVENLNQSVELRASRGVRTIARSEPFSCCAP